MDENLELDERELIEYVFEQLLKQGIVMNRRDIKRILDIELEYLIEHGFIEDIEE